MREDIQFFRGLAVFSVLLFHIDRVFIPNGYLGVDFFFVISGYLVLPMLLPLMSLNRVEGSNFLKEFFFRRFWRLAPTLLTAILISTVLMLLLAPITMHKTFAIQALFTFALLGNLGASKLSPDYFNSYSNPLVHTWSLAIEEQFYLLVPVMIIVIRMASRFWECHQQKIILYFLLFLAVVSLMKFVYSDLIYSFVVGETTLENMKDNYYSLSHRFWQLMVGGLVALLGSRVKKNSSSTSELISIGLLLSIAAILFFPLALNTTVATIYVTFASGLLLQLRIKKQISPRWLWRLGRWVGDISYPLYLLHVPIIFLAKFSPILMVGDGVSREIPVIVCVPVIFVFASIVHIRVEKRYRVANDK